MLPVAATCRKMLTQFQLPSRNSMQNTRPRRESASFLETHWAYSDFRSRSKCPDPCLFVASPRHQWSLCCSCQNQLNPHVLRMMAKMISKDQKAYYVLFNGSNISCNQIQKEAPIPPNYNYSHHKSELISLFKNQTTDGLQRSLLNRLVEPQY